MRGSSTAARASTWGASGCSATGSRCCLSQSSRRRWDLESRRLRLLALTLALGAALLTSNLAGVAPAEPRLAFLFGFVPPLATALLVINWRKLRRSR